MYVFATREPNIFYVTNTDTELLVHNKHLFASYVVGAEYGLSVGVPSRE